MFSMIILCLPFNLQKIFTMFLQEQSYPSQFFFKFSGEIDQLVEDFLWKTMLIYRNQCIVPKTKPSAAMSTTSQNITYLMALRAKLEINRTEDIL